MPGSLYGLATGSIPSNPYTSFVQSAGFYSAGSSASTEVVTLSTAPRGTLLGVTAVDHGTGIGWAYSVTNTGYTWYPLPSFMVDSNSYTYCLLWIGQPNSTVVVGGTSVTFQHNGSQSFRSAGVVELSHVIKGEVLTSYTRYGWTNSGTVWGGSGGGIFPSTTVTMPAEKGLVCFAAASMNTGGAGINTPNPTGFIRSLATATGAHAAVVIGVPAPRAVLTPGPWFTGGLTTTWSGTFLVLR